MTGKLPYSANKLRKFTVPGTNVGLFSTTDKMPCPSFGITAVETCPGAVFGDGMICQSCYATQGMYTWPVVRNAQRIRTDFVKAATKNPTFGDKFVESMVKGIRAAGTLYFRVHDSGDLFCVEYVRLWERIVLALPEVQFWFPTRMWHSRVNKDIIKAVKRLAEHPNAIVRPSQLAANMPPPRIEGYAAGTGAIDHDHPGFEGVNICPAPLQGGKCLDCRNCWDQYIPVVYRLHGQTMVQNVKQLIKARHDRDEHYRLIQIEGAA